LLRGRGRRRREGEGRESFLTCGGLGLGPR
jgi:hypothetical protein